MTAAAPSPQPRDHLTFAARHAVEIAETLEMLRTRVGDETDGRTREPDELGHVADAIRAHLDHGAPMRGLEAHQRHRHADVIVEIPVGRHARPASRQNRRRHFLGGGLAVAAAHADDRNRERCAPRGRQPLQRIERVRYHDLRDRCGGHRLLHQRADRAALCRGRHELPAVELRTLERDEERAGGERAAVVDTTPYGRSSPASVPPTSCAASSSVRFMPRPPGLSRLRRGR